MDTPSPEFTLPVIHLNGNSRATLLEQYTRADDAAAALVDAFMGIDFHARDYYPRGMDAFDRARLERNEIRNKIYDVLEYFRQHRLSLQSCAPHGVQLPH